MIPTTTKTKHNQGKFEIVAAVLVGFDKADYISKHVDDERTQTRKASGDMADLLEHIKRHD